MQGLISAIKTDRFVGFLPANSDDLTCKIAAFAPYCDKEGRWAFVLFTRPGPKGSNHSRFLTGRLSSALLQPDNFGLR